MLDSETVARILALRKMAHERGFIACKVELGPEETESLTLGAYYSLLGMGIRPRAEPGIAVVALPDRRIGRFEVVIPTRFEEAQI